VVMSRDFSGGKKRTKKKMEKQEREDREMAEHAAYPKRERKSRRTMRQTEREREREREREKKREERKRTVRNNGSETIMRYAAPIPFSLFSRSKLKANSEPRSGHCRARARSSHRIALHNAVAARRGDNLSNRRAVSYNQPIPLAGDSS